MLCLTAVSSSSLWNMSLLRRVKFSMWASNSFSFSSLSSCSVKSQRWSLRSCFRVSRHELSGFRTLKKKLSFSWHPTLPIFDKESATSVLSSDKNKLNPQNLQKHKSYQHNFEQEYNQTFCNKTLRTKHNWTFLYWKEN